MKSFIVWNGEEEDTSSNKEGNNSFIEWIKKPFNWQLVDEWVPMPQDNLFKTIDKAIILPVSNYYGFEKSTDLDYFIVSPKRCYNKPAMREHIVKYLNYFEKFYDTNHELVVIMYQIKYLIDYQKDYKFNNLVSDLRKYILYNRSILNKLYVMNEDNYIMELKAKEGRSVESLQYTTKHGKILMQMSVLMLMIIPLVCHFIHMNKLDNVDEILLQVFDDILCMSSVDIFSKLYETSASEVNRNEKMNKTLWDMQAIRGKNSRTHIMACIENIILNIMPKYTYEKNVINFNYVSIRYNTQLKITDIRYEYQFSQISSSNRDEDMNSDFDRYESYLIRQNESLYLQAKCSAQETMNFIENKFGPFDEDEIQYYIKNLENDSGNIINEFQKNMVFNLFYKYFGDTSSIKFINRIDYVKLIMSARRILEAYNMVILPYIISSKVVRIPNRKNINKKELTRIEADPLWIQIQKKYKNPRIEQEILGQIAVILSSEFKIIDYDNKDIDGKTIEVISDIIIEEYLLYILLI